MRCRRALAEVVSRQAHYQSSDPALRFVQLLQSALAGGQAYVANRKGGAPDEAPQWGWLHSSAHICDSVRFVRSDRNFDLEIVVSGQKETISSPFSRMTCVGRELGPQAIIYPGQHCAAVMLWYCWYNFGRIHKSLRSRRAAGIRLRWTGKARRYRPFCLPSETRRNSDRLKSS